MISINQVLLIKEAHLDTDCVEGFLTKSSRTTFQVTCAQSAAEAEDLLRGQFDLVLLDLYRLDAASLGILLRICALVPMSPVIVLTDKENPDEAMIAVRSGAHDCLSRERLSADDLIRACSYAIERYKFCRQSTGPHEAFLRTIVDTLPAHLAILDHQGQILAVNQAWHEFAVASGLPPETSFVGASYFNACTVPNGEDADSAAAAATGIREVIAGRRDYFALQYPCHSPDKQRWFHMHVAPFAEPLPRRVVVAHEDITDRVLAEIDKKRSDQLFEKVFTIAPLGLWLTDATGRLLRGNKEAYRIWGLNPTAQHDQPGLFTARRDHSQEPITPTDWAIVRSVREGVTIHDELLEVEARDGKKRFILNYTAPLEDHQGKIEGGVVANLDITQRIEAQKKIEASEQRARLIFDTSPNCVFIKDKQGRYKLVNQATATLFGTSVAFMEGKTDEELNGGHWEEDAPDQTTPRGRESRFLDADGTHRWFRFFIAPFSCPDNECGELTIAVDITEARQAQDEMRKSENQMRIILNSLGSEVVMLDREHQVIWANKKAQKQKTAGMNCFAHCSELIDSAQTAKKTCSDCPARKAFATGLPAQCARNVADGRTFSLSATPIIDHDGQVDYVVVTTMDITDRLSLERQLRQAQKMESLGTLAGGIAHDFNNILAALLGYADLARLRLADQPVVQDYLHEVAIAGKRASELVKQILTFSRCQDADLQPLHVPLVVKEALKLLRSSLPATIDLKTSISSSVDPVLADPTQIHQILMNLCINANHAMEPEGGTLTVGIDQVTPDPQFFVEHPELSPGSYLRLQVSDTGSGMTPEIVTAIFDPYFTTKAQGEGTGLGLSVVHGIVKQYRGEIIVDSAPGKGSTFTIYLPIAPKKEALPEQVIEQPLQGSGEHILLVDDEPILCKFYQQFLSRSRFERVNLSVLPDLPRADLFFTCQWIKSGMSRGFNRNKLKSCCF